jgi:hypothetical protein
MLIQLLLPKRARSLSTGQLCCLRSCYLEEAQCSRGGTRGLLLLSTERSGFDAERTTTRTRSTRRLRKWSLARDHPRRNVPSQPPYPTIQRRMIGWLEYEALSEQTSHTLAEETVSAMGDKEQESSCNHSRNKLHYHTSCAASLSTSKPSAVTSKGTRFVTSTP